jgi:hypothetical protein
MILDRSTEYISVKQRLGKDKNSNHLGTFVFWCVVCVVTLQMSYLARAQVSPTSSEITFHTPNREADWPVYILQLKLDGKIIPMDTPVHVEPGWHKKLVVVVENSGPKNIVEGGVQLEFHETGLGTHDSPITATTANLGQYPDFAKYRPDGTTQKLPERPPINVPIGGQLDFSFSDISNDGIEDEAQKRAGHITRIDIKLLRFFFADSSQWMMGNFFMPDGESGKWKKVSAQEFYTRSK